MAKKPKEPPTNTGEPISEDPESQPHGKHKRGTQGTLPGVYEGVKKYPKLDRAMNDLLAKLDEANKADLDFQDQKRTVKEMCVELGIPSYAIEGLMVGTTEKETRLYVKRLKEPKKKKPEESAA